MCFDPRSDLRDWQRVTSNATSLRQYQQTTSSLIPHPLPSQTTPSHNLQRLSHDQYELILKTTSELSSLRESGDVRKLTFLLSGVVKRNHLGLDDAMELEIATVAGSGMAAIASASTRPITPPMLVKSICTSTLLVMPSPV